MDTPPTSPDFVAVDRPVFVLGERPAAVELVRALGAMPGLCPLPPNRLLADLVSAVHRCRGDLEPVIQENGGRAPTADWYGDLQAAWQRASGKPRTIEFSGLSILRLCDLFPTAQFIVVRQLKRAIPRSRRLPPFGRERIFEVDSGSVTSPETLEHVLAFLGEATQHIELDLSDDRISSTAATPPA